MGEKPNTIAFVSHNPPPKPAEQKDRQLGSFAEIAGRATSEFTTPEAKRIFAEELAKELAARKGELSPDLQRQLESTNGQVNMKKATQILGLGNHLKDQISDDGTLPETSTAHSETFTIPDRTASTGGTELLRQWGLNQDMNKKQEELTQKIIAEIEKGNVPDSCRNMKTITMQGADGTKISFRTSAGYLAIGTNEDNIRVPLSGPMAKRITDHFGWTLPTAAMAATVDSRADIQLRIGGETYSNYDLAHMADLEYARKHNVRAQKKLAEIAHQQGLTPEQLSQRLIRGEKKNIFIGQGATRGGIGIGGLLDGNGKNIQSYTYPHGAEKGPNGEPGFHGDYSQSIAVQDAMITVVTPDGKPHQVHLYDALRDPQYAKILNPSEPSNGGTFDARVAYTAPASRSTRTA